MLEDYKKKAEDKGVENVKLILETGSAKNKIAKHLASEYDIDMIIIGATKGDKMNRLLLGSVADGIVSQAKCDVLIVR